MRGLKSADLFAILDFLYCGEANVYQENLESFLAIAEELQLEGLVGNANYEEAIQKESPNIKVPNIAEPVFKKDKSISKSVAILQTLDLTSANFDSANNFPTGTLALPRDVSGDIEKLDEQINLMMEKTARKNAHGQPFYACNICGKENKRSHMKNHIEANHLDGVSIPCNLCELTFRSRKTKRNQMRAFHKAMKDMTLI